MESGNKNGLGLLDTLPIEIHFEIFAHLSLRDLTRTFCQLNRKCCSLIGRYCLMNEYFIGQHFHPQLLSSQLSGKNQQQSSNDDGDDDYQNKRKEKIEYELLNGLGGGVEGSSTFPYLIRSTTNNSVINGISPVIGDGNHDEEQVLDDLRCLEQIGPMLLTIILSGLIKSIEEEMVTFNLFNVNYESLKSQLFQKGVLPTFDRIKHLERLYLRCGPVRVENIQSVSPCLNTQKFMSYLKNSYSSLRELYLSGFVGSSSDEINSIVQQLENLEKLHISFTLEFNSNVQTIDPLEAPKSLREKLTHISLINVPPRATRLFSVIDIFETFENLRYFEYHEVKASGGLNINIKFDNYDKVVEKFSKTKLETLIYNPSHAHQRHLSSVHERESLIEEILENIKESADFPPLFSKLKNVEVSEYSIQRERKYDGLSAVIYYLLPTIVVGTCERVHAPSDCLELASSILNSCSKNLIEFQIGDESKQQAKFKNYQSATSQLFNCSSIFCKPFDKLKRLVVENLKDLDPNLLALIGRTCMNLKFLKLSNCQFQDVQIFSNTNSQELHTSTTLNIQIIAIQYCTNIPLCHLTYLMMCSCITLEHLIIKESWILTNSSRMVLNGGVQVEMKKLRTLLFPKLEEQVYNEIMSYLAKYCRFSCLNHLDIYGALDDSLEQFFESNSIASISLNVSTITNMNALKIIYERGIKLKSIEVEKAIDIEQFLKLTSPHSTCSMTLLKLLGTKLQNDDQVRKLAKLIAGAKDSLHTVCLSFAKDVKILPILQALQNSRTLSLVIFGGYNQGNADFSFDQLLELLLGWPNLSLITLNLSPYSAESVPPSEITSAREMVAKLQQQRSGRTIPKIFLPNNNETIGNNTIHHQQKSGSNCVIS